MPSAIRLPDALTELAADVALTSVARGDVLYRGASKWNNLAAGTSGYFLKSNGAGADPSWAAASTSPGGSSGQVQYNSSGSFAGAAAVTYAASGANLTVTAQAATDVPLTVKGATSQSANLAEWKDSTGTQKFRVGADGSLKFGQDSAANSGEFTIYGGVGYQSYLRFAAGGDVVLRSNLGYAITLENSQGGHGVGVKVPQIIHTDYIQDFYLESGGTYGDNQSAGHLHLRGGQNWAGGTTNCNAGHVYAYGGDGAGGGTNGHVCMGWNGSAAKNNVSLFAAGSFGGGVNVMFIANAGTNPSSNPTGGGIIYCDGGALKYRGSSGTVTTLGAA